MHSRYRTEAHQDVVGRFNERSVLLRVLNAQKAHLSVLSTLPLPISRFLLSLASCRNCMVIDDQLNVLPMSSHMANIKPVPPKTQVSTRTNDLHGNQSRRHHSLVCRLHTYTHNT